MFIGSFPEVLHVLISALLIYMILIAILRVSGKHALSQFSAFDFVVAISVGNLMATGILDKNVPILNAALAIALIVGLQVLLSWLGTGQRWARRVLQSEPRLLVHKGRMIQRALCEERVPDSEILQQIRAKGIGSLKDVEAVVLEANGSLSIIRTPDKAGDSCNDVQQEPKDETENQEK